MTLWISISNPGITPRRLLCLNPTRHGHSMILWKVHRTSRFIANGKKWKAALLKKQNEDRSSYILGLFRYKTLHYLRDRLRFRPLRPRLLIWSNWQRNRRKQSFLHYITAIYGGYYNAYERALSEIDKALSLEPKSSRYLATKGRLLVNYGAWVKRDGEIEKGIDLLRKAKELCPERGLEARQPRPASEEGGRIL